MIKANELRHMNLHWFDGRIGCLSIDDKFSFYVSFHDTSVPLASFSVSQIKPLFITPTILKEAGFNLKAEADDPLYTGWFFKDFKQWRVKVWKEDFESSYRAAIAGGHFINLTSFHQLQNCFYSFTKEELLTYEEVEVICTPASIKTFNKSEPNGY